MKQNDANLLVMFTNNLQKSKTGINDQEEAKKKKKKNMSQCHASRDTCFGSSIYACLLLFPRLLHVQEDTQQTHNMVITSFRRRFDIVTSQRCLNDVITTSCVY